MAMGSGLMGNIVNLFIIVVFLAIVGGLLWWKLKEIQDRNNRGVL